MADRAGTGRRLHSNHPWVRAIAPWETNEGGFYFETLNPKDVHQQLEANPKVEICFFNNESDLKSAKTMRLTGEVEFLDDPDLEQRLLQDWPFLQEAEPVVERFRIPSGEACFWTMSDALKEKEIERLKFESTPTSTAPAAVESSLGAGQRRFWGLPETLADELRPMYVNYALKGAAPFEAAPLNVGGLERATCSNPPKKSLQPM